MAWLVGGAVLALYLLSLCPAVYIGDSGELTAAAATLGIAHPPGYPLYVLVGRLFALLPIGSVAVRLNGMSALFGAGAAALASLVALRLFGGDRGGGRGREAWIAAIAIAAAYASARTVWSEGVKAEVYALHLFWIALLLFFAARRVPSALLFFLLGLAAANHQTVLLLAPGLAYLYAAAGERSARSLGVAAAAFAAGASIYLFLLVRPDAPGLFAWRKPHGLAGFAEHVLRAQYGRLSELPRSFALAADQLFFLARLLVRELMLFAALLPFGLVRAFRRGAEPFHRSLAIHFTLFSVGLLFFLNHGTDPRDASVASVFYLPAVLLGFLVGAPILVDLARRAERVRPRLSFAILLAAALPLAWNAPACSARGFTFADEAGRAMLDAAPDGSVLLTEGDNDTFVLYYLQTVEGKRRDVEILDRDLNLFPERFAGAPGEPISLRKRDQTIERLVASGSKPVFSVARYTEGTVAGKRLASVGPLYRFLSPEETVTPTDFARYHPRGIAAVHIRDDYMARRFAVGYLFRWIDHYRLTGNRSGLAEANEKLLALGKGLRETHLVSAEAALAEGDSARAIDELDRAVAIDPGYLEGRRRLAELLRARGEIARAAEEYREAAERSGASGDLLNLGNALVVAGEEEEAARAYHAATEAAEVDTLVLAGAARGFGALGMPADQVAALEAVRALGGPFGAYEELGDAYALLGRSEEARGAYAEAARGNGGSAQIAYKLGVTLLRLARTGEAEVELERAVSIDPAHADALNALAYLRAGESGRLEEALGLVDRALASPEGRDTGYYHDTRGVILAKLGRSREAEGAFRKAIETIRRDDEGSIAESCLHLAEALEARGEREEGRRFRVRADSLRALAGGSVAPAGESAP